MFELVCSGCSEIIGSTSKEVPEGTQILCTVCSPIEEEVEEEIPEEIPEA